MRGILKKRSNIFLFSDFMDDNFEASLRLMGMKHDLVAVVVNDPAEQKIPDMGLVDLHDAETGEVVTVDTSSSSFRRHYESIMHERKTRREKLLRKSQVDSVEISSSDQFIDEFIGFFKKRNRR